MAFARAVAVLAVAVAALPATGASATAVCVRVEPNYYPYVCRDGNYPGCVVYGSLGEEGRFHVGNCPWPYGR